jgi:hypothetical protein
MRYAEPVFLHPMRSTGHVVHSGAFGARNVEALLLKLEWSHYGFDKMCAGTRYAELVFLHPVGFAGHVVHTGASGARNVDTIFFLLGCDLRVM